MRAIVLVSPGPLGEGPLELRELPDPSPGPGQVVLQVEACGVCRSNLHMIEGEWVARNVPSHLPIVPGHEVVGTVAALGPGVERLAVGERVGVQPLWSACGRCEYCLTGREHLCAGKEVTGETVDGGYAEYMLAMAEYVYRVPDGLAPPEAAPLFCPGVTAYGAVAKAGIRPGSKLAVYGIGGVGHLVIQLAMLAGAEVTALGRGAEHLALAGELGARALHDGAGEGSEQLMREGGVDGAIVFAPASEVVRRAVMTLKPGGVAVVGVGVELGPLAFEEKRIVSSVIGPRQHMHEVLALAAAGKLQVSEETFSLAEAATALATLKEGAVRARAVLVP